MATCVKHLNSSRQVGLFTDYGFAGTWPSSGSRCLCMCTVISL